MIMFYLLVSDGEQKEQGTVQDIEDEEAAS